MDFDEYVAARRATLVRVVTLLGAPESEASHLVADALARSAREISSSDNPDPEIYRVLLKSVGRARDSWPTPPALPEEDARNAAGLAVRRSLAGLDPDERDALILLHHGDLTVREAAEATRTKPGAVQAGADAGLTALGAAGEHEIRGLLQRAADTVEVPVAGVLEPAPPPRRWPWVTAATAAVVAVTAVLATQTSSAKEDPEDKRLRADQVPSLFGYDADGARALLEGLGLQVTVQPSRNCDVNGRVITSDPATGTRFDPGNSITIRTAVPSDIGCMAHYHQREIAWQFVDFANGRGQAPYFANRVFLVANGSTPEVISANDALDPTGWGGLSALTELRWASAQVVRKDADTYLTPTMTAETVVPPIRTCGIERPVGAGRRAALRVTVAAGPADCPVTVDLYLGRGAIDAVVLYVEDPSPWAGKALSPPPWVTGGEDGRSWIRGPDYL